MDVGFGSRGWHACGVDTATACMTPAVPWFDFRGSSIWFEGLVQGLGVRGSGLGRVVQGVQEVVFGYQASSTIVFFILSRVQHHVVEYDPFIKVDLPHAINFRASCGANLVT